MTLDGTWKPQDRSLHSRRTCKHLKHTHVFSDLGFIQGNHSKHVDSIFPGQVLFRSQVFSDKLYVWRVKKLYKVLSNDCINAYVILSAVILIFYISSRQKPYHLIGDNPMCVLSTGNFVLLITAPLFLTHVNETSAVTKLGHCHLVFTLGKYFPLAWASSGPSSCRCSMTNWLLTTHHGRADTCLTFMLLKRKPPI